MRRLLLFALLVVPAWPNACTLTSNAGSACASKACTLSAIAADTTHSNWTGTGCTGNGYVPAGGTSAGVGDTITIPDGYALTDNLTSWAIGANNASNGTPAIQLNVTSSGSSFTVAGGATLTLRGDLLWMNNYFNVPLANAGATIVFDSSHSASPTATRYRIGSTQASAAVGVNLSGTSASHVTVTSVGGTALNGQFRSGANAVGAAPATGGWVSATYTDFSNIGDTAANGESFAFSYASAAARTFSITNSTFNNVGPMYYTSTNVPSGGTLTLSGNVWTNSPGVNNVNLGFVSGATGTVSNNVFDKRYGDGNGGCATVGLTPGVVFSGNFFGAGICTISTQGAFTANFIPSLCTGEITIPGSTPSLLYIYCSQDEDNAHISSPPTWAQTLTRAVFDPRGPMLSDDGSAYHAGGAPGVVASLTNSVILPDRNGNGTINISDPTPGVQANTLAHNHNAGIPTVGMTVDEGGATSVKVSSYKSNAFLAFPSAANVIHNVGNTPNTLDLCSTSTSCDYNSVYPLSVSTAPCLACTGAQNGYSTKMDFSPNYTGTHDVSTDRKSVV